MNSNEKGSPTIAIWPRRAYLQSAASNSRAASREGVTSDGAAPLLERKRELPRVRHALSRDAAQFPESKGADPREDRTEILLQLSSIFCNRFSNDHGAMTSTRD